MLLGSKEWQDVTRNIRRPFIEGLKPTGTFEPMIIDPAIDFPKASQ